MSSNARKIIFPVLHFERDLLAGGISLDQDKTALSNTKDPGCYQFSGTRSVESLPTEGPAAYWEVDLEVQYDGEIPRREICSVGVATDNLLRSCSNKEGFVVTGRHGSQGVRTLLYAQTSSIWALSNDSMSQGSHVKIVECQPAGTTRTIIVKLGFLWDPQKRRILVIDLWMLNALLQARLQVSEPLYFAGEVMSANKCKAIVKIKLLTGPELEQSISPRKLKDLNHFLDTCQ